MAGRTTFIYRDGKLIEKPREDTEARLQIIHDHTDYLSPLGTGHIGSRYQRREDLKRGNCREVDPSEFKPSYDNPRFRKKRGHIEPQE